MIPDQNLIGLGSCFWNLFEMKNFRGSIFYAYNRFHDFQSPFEKEYSVILNLVVNQCDILTQNGIGVCIGRTRGVNKRGEETELQSLSGGSIALP